MMSMGTKSKFANLFAFISFILNGLGESPVFVQAMDGEVLTSEEVVMDGKALTHEEVVNKFRAVQGPTPQSTSAQNIPGQSILASRSSPKKTAFLHEDVSLSEARDRTAATASLSQSSEPPRPRAHRLNSEDDFTKARLQGNGPQAQSHSDDMSLTNDVTLQVPQTVEESDLGSSSKSLSSTPTADAIPTAALSKILFEDETTLDRLSDKISDKLSDNDKLSDSLSGSPSASVTRASGSSPTSLSMSPQSKTTLSLTQSSGSFDTTGTSVAAVGFVNNIKADSRSNSDATKSDKTDTQPTESSPVSKATVTASTPSLKRVLDTEIDKVQTLPVAPNANYNTMVFRRAGTNVDLPAEQVEGALEEQLETDKQFVTDSKSGPSQGNGSDGREGSRSPGPGSPTAGRRSSSPHEEALNKVLSQQRKLGRLTSKSTETAASDLKSQVDTTELLLQSAAARLSDKEVLYMNKQEVLEEQRVSQLEEANELLKTPTLEQYKQLQKGTNSPTDVVVFQNTIIPRTLLAYFFAKLFRLVSFVTRKFRLKNMAWFMRSPLTLCLLHRIDALPLPPFIPGLGNMIYRGWLKKIWVLLRERGWFRDESGKLGRLQMQMVGRVGDVCRSFGSSVSSSSNQVVGYEGGSTRLTPGLMIFKWLQALGALGDGYGHGELSQNGGGSSSSSYSSISKLLDMKADVRKNPSQKMILAEQNVRTQGQAKNFDAQSQSSIDSRPQFRLTVDGDNISDFSGFASGAHNNPASRQSSPGRGSVTSTRQSSPRAALQSQHPLSLPGHPHYDSSSFMASRPVLRERDRTESADSESAANLKYYSEISPTYEEPSGAEALREDFQTYNSYKKYETHERKRQEKWDVKRNVLKRLGINLVLESDVQEELRRREFGGQSLVSQEFQKRDNVLKLVNAQYEGDEKMREVRRAVYGNSLNSFSGPYGGSTNSELNLMSLMSSTSSSSNSNPSAAGLPNSFFERLHDPLPLPLSIGSAIGYFTHLGSGMRMIGNPKGVVVRPPMLKTSVDVNGMIMTESIGSVTTVTGVDCFEIEFPEYNYPQPLAGSSKNKALDRLESQLESLTEFSGISTPSPTVPTKELTILYLHGGGYAWLTGHSHAEWISRLTQSVKHVVNNLYLKKYAEAAGKETDKTATEVPSIPRISVRALVVNYRTTKDAPFPAALFDCWKVYQALAVNPTNLILNSSNYKVKKVKWNLLFL